MGQNAPVNALSKNTIAAAILALLVVEPATSRADTVLPREPFEPGMAVLVVDDGRTRDKTGFGYADLDDDVRISQDSAFRLASVSKQFTTAAVIALANDGKLDYDDLLVKYVPEFASWPGVTIRHLMTHTSGIPDYYERDYYAEYPADGPMPQNADLVEILSRYPEPDFAPGEKHVYNNAAYEVLVTVVERVSGSDFTDFLKTKVFEPAGMKRATTFNSSRADIPDRVIGYDPTDEGFAINDYDPFNDMLGAGGVYATLHDLEAWANLLATNNPYPAEALEPAVLNDGTVTDYGFGWVIDEHRGFRRMSHTGSWVGFRTAIAHYPDEKLTIVVLANRSDYELTELVDGLADGFLPAESE